MSTPYIGSKISLISKSEIRYEGILYTVDPKESTIALAKVRSFGTENRATETPMPPREDVYEYIIFKASDIKDLTVCETPQPAPQIYGGLPYDPAIVSVSKSTGHQVQSAPFSSSDMPPGSQLSGLAPSKAVMAASGTSTRSETPLNRETSPKTEMGVQTHNNIAPQNRAPGAGRQQASRRSGGGGGQQRTVSGSGGASGQQQHAQHMVGGQGAGGHHQQQRHPQHPQQQRDGGHRQQTISEGSNGGVFGGFQPPRGEMHNRGAFRNRGGGGGAGGMRRGGAGYGAGGNFFTPLSGPFFRGGGGFQQHGGGSGRGGGGGGGGSGMSHHQGGPSPFIYRGGFMPRGGGGGGQQHQQRRSSQSKVTANTSQQPQQQRRASGGHALKFDSDYDWELANIQFQETLRLKDDGPAAKPDESKEETKEDENVAGSDSPVVAADNNGGEHSEENKDKPPCYDKNKSFFDAISCEALERADGINGAVLNFKLGWLVNLNPCHTYPNLNIEKWT